jgi:hypothetical protein
VFKLIKLIIGVVGLGAFVWWGLTVPLGDRTLFGHLSAIGQSKESQELVRGTKLKVGDLKKRIAGAEASDGKAAKGDKAAKGEDDQKDETLAPSEHAPVAPQERLTSADRKQIRHFIDSARAKVTKSN